MTQPTQLRYFVQDGAPLRHKHATSVGSCLEGTMMRKINGQPNFPFLFVPIGNIREADLVIFTGGADIAPRLYGEAALAATSFNASRDVNDIWAYNWSRDKVKLGICRGAQLLNVLSGGSLWQDVDGHRSGHHLMECRVPPSKDLDNPESSRGWGKSRVFKVTSAHHQMMRLGEDAVLLGHAIPNEEKPYRGSVCSVKSSGSKWVSTNVMGARERQFVPEVLWTENEWQDEDLFDPEAVWYPKTESLCVQGHPEYTNADDEFVSYVGELLTTIFKRKAA